MAEQKKLSQSSVEDAVRSGQRAAAAHEAFATDAVRLAFGKLAKGRLVHVSDVERGLAANAFCPACSERLIARKGKRKSWHFAHANGHACREALTATLAAWLSQCLEDGAPLHLPALEIRWGKARFHDQEARKIVFTGAKAIRSSSNGSYEVLADVTGSNHSLRIIFRAARSFALPSQEDLAQEGISTLLVDFYTPLMEWTASHPNATIEEPWLTRELLDEAPRQWVWSAREHARRDILIRQRLSRHLRAIADVDAMSGKGSSKKPTRAETALEKHGLLHLAETPEIEGERFLGPWPRAWRAAIVADLVLLPFSGGLTEVLLKDAGFGRRKIIGEVARHRMVVLGQVMRPLEENDQIELKKLVPDLRKPIEIIEDYLSQLSSKGAVMASSRKAKSLGLPKCAIDPRLDTLSDIDWVASPKITQHAMRVAAADALLRKSNLSGSPAR